jgi:hypothetical protein
LATVEELVRELVYGATIGIALIACSTTTDVSEPPVVAIVTDRSSYAPGDSVVVQVTNLTLAAVRYNLCPGDLQRWSGSRWDTAVSWTEGVCRDNLNSLAAGSTVTIKRPLATTRESGVYRYLFYSVLDAEENLLPVSARVSNSFLVN